MSKPIETGCLAILIESLTPSNKGRIVTVGKAYIHSGTKMRHVEFQSEVLVTTLYQAPGKPDRIDQHRSKVGNCPESWLRRIDGDDDMLSMDDHFDAMEDRIIADGVPA